MVDKIRTPKDISILIPETYEIPESLKPIPKNNVTLYEKRDFQVVIKLRILRWWEHLDLSR